MRQHRLYYHDACLYCIHVLGELNKLDTVVELRNILRNSNYRHQLRQGGGKQQVPCLQTITCDGQEEWLYESSAIIERLQHIAKPAV